MASVKSNSIHRACMFELSNVSDETPVVLRAWKHNHTIITTGEFTIISQTKLQCFP